MATEAVEIILKKEKEAEDKINEMYDTVSKQINDAKIKAEEKRQGILSCAKQEAEAILSNANAEIDKMYADAQIKAEQRKNEIKNASTEFKEKSVEIVIDILFN